MKFFAIKTEDGEITGKIAFYCRALYITRQAFYDYLDRKNMPWKYEPLAEEMMKIHDEDKRNDTYGRERMYLVLLLKKKPAKSLFTYPAKAQSARSWIRSS